MGWPVPLTWPGLRRSLSLQTSPSLPLPCLLPSSPPGLPSLPSLPSPPCGVSPPLLHLQHLPCFPPGRISRPLSFPASYTCSNSARVPLPAHLSARLPLPVSFSCYLRWPRSVSSILWHILALFLPILGRFPSFCINFTVFLPQILNYNRIINRKFGWTNRLPQQYNIDTGRGTPWGRSDSRRRNRKYPVKKSNGGIKK